MASVATMQNRGPNNPQNGAQSQRVPLVPFIRASALHREPAITTTPRQLTGTAQDLGVFDIPAYGYLRSLVLLVTASGGAGAATATEDAPWNVLQNIFLTEPNGSVLSQFNSGWDLKIAQKWGGYRWPWGGDPQASPAYVDSTFLTAGNFQFMLRLPVELSERDGLASLPNQNAAAVFKLRMSLAGQTTVYATGPATTLPTVTIQVFLEAYDQPEVQSAGVTNQITPPAMNTTSFWSPQIFNVSAGQQTIRLTRVGNYIRNLVFVYRRGGTSRVTGDLDWPNPLTLYLDTRPLDIIERQNWKNQMYERTGFGGTEGHRFTTTPGNTLADDSSRGLDSGVFVYDFTHEFDGGLGYENRDLWLPTLGSTRLEIQGNFANAGVLTVFTNDVAIAGSVFI